MNVFIVLCHIYAGIDPGMNPEYVPSYHVLVTNERKKLEDYLMENPNCQLFEGRQIEYDLKSVTVQKEEQKIVGVEIKEKK